jgi:Gpi18-like mannosyltransferase
MVTRNLKLYLLSMQAQFKIHGLKLDEFLFVFSMWLLSRLIITIGMQLIAPAVPLEPIGFNAPNLDTLQIKNFTPHLSWELFTHWDGEHYRNIVTKGYAYIHNVDLIYEEYKYSDEKQYNIAFFPMYPMIVKLLMSIGIPFDIAGTIVSNMCFLTALLIFYSWIKKIYDHSIARWTIAVMAWFPMSLFCSVTYTESCFLLLTISTLVFFENRQYVGASFLGMLATATRPTGLVLIPALLLFAWVERRPLIAYLSAIMMAGGLIAFSMFCWYKFNQPFAFILAQGGWPQPSWFDLLKNIVDPVLELKLPIYLYILIAVIIMINFILLFCYPAWGSLMAGIILLPLIAYHTIILQVLTPIIAVWLIWHFRQKFSPILLIYGCCFLVFLFLTGTKMSIHRHLYTIAPMSLALGILFSTRPRTGYISISLFGFLLLFYSIRFAWWDWIA